MLLSLLFSSSLLPAKPHKMEGTKDKFFAPGKCTVYVSFVHNPLRFELYDERGKVYFFRELGGKFGSIKFNICKKGFYRFSEPCIVNKIVPIEIKPFGVDLPPIDRDRAQSVKVVYNPDLKNTPARIFSKKGIIEVGPRFKTFPFPTRLFILCHEVGHLFYSQEEDADLYACKIFLENGYNKSSAFYALSRVLKINLRNKNRILKIFKHVTNES